MTRPMVVKRARAVVALLAVAAIVAGTGGSAVADPLPASECNGLAGFVVNFLNGVSNTEKQANKSLIVMQRALGSSHVGEPIEYHLLYNDTNGQIADVAEVFEQKIREAVELGIITQEQIGTLLSRVVGASIKASTAPARVLAWVMSRVPIEQIREAGDGFGSFLDALPGWYEDAHDKVYDWMTDQVRRFADWALLDEQTRAIVDGHVATVRGQIASGKKSLIVSHSQGNLFANPVAHDVGRWCRPTRWEWYMSPLLHCSEAART